MQHFSTHFVKMVKSGTILLPEEDAKVSYIDVRDIAACAAKLLVDSDGFENSFYALTGPEGISLADVAEQIATASGREVQYTAIGEDDYIEALKSMNMPDWNINMLISLTRVVKLGMIGNVTKAVEHVTGTPARTFTEFASEHAAVWK